MGPNGSDLSSNYRRGDRGSRAMMIGKKKCYLPGACVRMRLLRGPHAVPMDLLDPWTRAMVATGAPPAAETGGLTPRPSSASPTTFSSTPIPTSTSPRSQTTTSPAATQAPWAVGFPRSPGCRISLRLRVGLSPGPISAVSRWAPRSSIAWDSRRALWPEVAAGRRKGRGPIGGAARYGRSMGSRRLLFRITRRRP